MKIFCVYEGGRRERIWVLALNFDLCVADKKKDTERGETYKDRTVKWRKE